MTAILIVSSRLDEAHGAVRAERPFSSSLPASSLHRARDCGTAARGPLKSAGESKKLPRVPCSRSYQPHRRLWGNSIPAKVYPSVEEGSSRTWATCSSRELDFRRGLARARGRPCRQGLARPGSAIDNRREISHAVIPGDGVRLLTAFGADDSSLIPSADGRRSLRERAPTTPQDA